LDAATTFSDEEIAYLRSQRLARIATVAPDGQPDVSAVGFEFDGTHFFVGSHGDPATTRKFRNLRAGNTKDAGVIRSAPQLKSPESGDSRSP
jgi:pyridoxamine 5'-phosphate oxidase family protein